MNCKKCGAENVDGAKFCCKCGSPLDTPEKNTKINFSDINVEKILSNDKIPKQVKDIINKIMQLPRKVLIGAVAGIVVLIVLIGAVRSHGRTIDLNKYLTINTSGYNGYGSVTAEVDWDSFEEKYDSKISYKKKNLLNKLERFLWDDRSPMNFLEGNVSVSIENDGTYFSNGDKVAYTWNVSDDLQGALNYKLKYKDGTIKVSGLEDAKKVDVFDDVSVDFEGQEPEGTATMTYQGNELDDSYFQYEPSEGLSNGDKVTVTLSEEGVARLTRDYGEVPEETEKEYTVSGLVCPLKSLNQIDDDSMKTLKKQAEDVYASYMGQNWDETSTLESLTYLGDYLLTDKNDSDGNILYLVYKAEIRSQYSDEEDGDTDTTDDIYWYISYSNVMLSDEGLQLDLVDYRTPGETTEVEGKGYNWSYYGYDSLDSLYKDVVTSNMDVYNHEDNVEDK